MKLLLVMLFASTLPCWGKCRYQIDPKDVALTFTGYKFTEKTGVSGRFKAIQWAFAQKAKNLATLLNSASVWIDSHSIDAGNAARNSNITRGLFRNLVGGRFIRGHLVDVAKDRRSATLKLSLGSRIETMLPLNIEHNQSAKTFTLSGTLDLIKAGAGKAFAALSKVCGPNHRGKDGKIVSWPTVDLLVQAKYTEQCTR